MSDVEIVPPPRICDPRPLYNLKSHFDSVFNEWCGEQENKRASIDILAGGLLFYRHMRTKLNKAIYDATHTTEQKEG